MRVMVIGASTNREKYGNKAVRAFLQQGATVFPVNPRADEIEGLTCYRSIADVPGPVDRATVYLPPALGVAAMHELALRGDVAEVWLNPGADSPAVIAAAKSAGLTVIQACSIVAIGVNPHAL